VEQQITRCFKKSSMLVTLMVKSSLKMIIKNLRIGWTRHIQPRSNRVNLVIKLSSLHQYFDLVEVVEIDESLPQTFYQVVVIFHSAIPVSSRKVSNVMFVLVKELKILPNRFR
jgi:hypothetical protein